MTHYVYDDGGRAAAGYKGKAGDCVARAVAIASGQPYAAVYARLADGQASNRVTKRTSATQTKRSASNGVLTKRKWFHDYMVLLGFVWTPTMTIGSGCKVHLRTDELPSGRLVVSVSKHLTAMIDGVIHDTYDPSANRRGTLYPLSTPTAKLPKSARLLDNGNGWLYEPERCVYGYYKLVSCVTDDTQRAT